MGGPAAADAHEVVRDGPQQRVGEPHLLAVDVEQPGGLRLGDAVVGLAQALQRPVDDGELEAPKPVEALPRPLMAPELVGREAAVAAARERAIRGERTSAA